MSVNGQDLDAVDENRLIAGITAALPRSERSRNRLHESDAELVDIGLEATWLAATTDTVAEEITTGLYADPELMGWMAVTVNLSDLAAVGARPVGLLLSLTLDPAWDEAFVGAVSRGIAQACRAHDCGILGGDTNVGSPALGGTALGLVARERAMRRVGMEEGDGVYLTGPVGLGGAYAAAWSAGPPLAGTVPYRPVARLPEAAVIARFASACMDTSDGLMFTLDQLARLNRAALEVRDLDALLHPAAAAICRAAGLPPLLLLSVIHGEFELCFTVPARREEAFRDAMAAAGFAPLCAGRVRVGGSARPGVFVEERAFPGAGVRNLWSRGGSPQEILAGLRSLLAPFGTGGDRSP